MKPKLVWKTGYEMNEMLQGSLNDAGKTLMFTNFYLPEGNNHAVLKERIEVGSSNKQN